MVTSTDQTDNPTMVVIGSSPGGHCRDVGLNSIEVIRKFDDTLIALPDAAQVRWEIWLDAGGSKDGVGELRGMSTREFDHRLTRTPQPSPDCDADRRMGVDQVADAIVDGCNRHLHLGFRSPVGREISAKHIGAVGGKP